MIDLTGGFPGLSTPFGPLATPDGGAGGGGGPVVVIPEPLITVGG
jgi:hypothetical protein